MKKLILTITAALLLACAQSCSFNPQCHTQDVSEYEQDVFEHTQDVSNCDKVYTAEDVCETIASALSEYETRVKFDGDIELDTIAKAVQMVNHFYPEFFWLNGYCSTPKSITFGKRCNYSADELRIMHEKLLCVVDSVIAKIPVDYNDYEKALFVHDYIVNNTRYAYEKLELKDKGFSGCAYGCLVEGRAVCQGYSEAYSLIMQKLGIECGVCSGQTCRASHAWNYIKIYGSYYWVDVTWDDPLSEDGDVLRHDYFLINDELLLRTRKLSDSQYYVPNCSSMECNYFVMNNAYFKSYNLNEINRLLADNAKSDVVEMMFENTESLKAAESNSLAMKRKGKLIIPHSISCDDTMNVLRLYY